MLLRAAYLPGSGPTTPTSKSTLTPTLLSPTHGMLVPARRSQEADPTRGLKRKLEQQEGIPAVRMRLSYLDILLQDQRTLGSYEIEKTHPIQMVLTEPTDDFDEASADRALENAWLRAEASAAAGASAAEAGVGRLLELWVLPEEQAAALPRPDPSPVVHPWCRPPLGTTEIREARPCSLRCSAPLRPSRSPASSLDLD